MFLKIPSSRRYILVAPILEYVDLTKYFRLGSISQVSVGGESYDNARICDFDWVKQIYLDCKRNDIPFDFHQTGSNFIKNGRVYKIRHKDEYRQAAKGLKYLCDNF